MESNYNIIGTDSCGDWLLLTVNESNLNFFMNRIGNDPNYTRHYHRIQAVKCSA